MREDLKAQTREQLRALKKYSGKHNAAHTWITDGYCNACKARLTAKQLEEEFGWNAALDEAAVVIDSLMDQAYEAGVRDAERAIDSLETDSVSVAVHYQLSAAQAENFRSGFVTCKEAAHDALLPLLSAH